MLQFDEDLFYPFRGLGSCKDLYILILSIMSLPLVDITSPFGDQRINEPRQFVGAGGDGLALVHTPTRPSIVSPNADWLARKFTAACLSACAARLMFLVPVDSIATVSTLHTASQSASADKSSVKLGNSRTGWSSRSAGTATKWLDRYLLLQYLHSPHPCGLSTNVDARRIGMGEFKVF